jgi:hypothetical protein
MDEKIIRLKVENGIYKAAFKLLKQLMEEARSSDGRYQYVNPEKLEGVLAVANEARGELNVIGYDNAPEAAYHA